MLAVATALFPLVCGSGDSLVNGDFEAKPSKGDPVPGWTLELGAQNGATKPESRVELDRKEKSGGRRSLHLSGDRATRGWMILKQEIETRPGGEYRLVARAKTKGVEPNGFGLNNCYVGLIFFDADEQVAGRDFQFPTLPTAGWSELEARVTAGHGARRGYVYVFLSMLGDLWVDDLQLEIQGGEVLAAPEPLASFVNGDFEARSSRGEPVPGWTLELGAQNGATTPLSRVELDAREKHGGKRSLHLAGDPATRGWRILKQEIETRPGGDYRLTAQVKTAGVEPNGFGLNNCYVGLIFFDAQDGVAGREFVFPHLPGSEWSTLEANVRAGPTARRGFVYVFLSMLGDLWVDDVRLEVAGGERVAQLEQLVFEDFEGARRPPKRWTRAEGATHGPASAGDPATPGSPATDDAASTDSAIEIDTAVGAADSGRSLRLSGNAGTRRWWSLGPEQKAKPGQLWRWSAQVKARDIKREGRQHENLHLSLLFLDREGEVLERKFGRAGAGTFDWKRVTVKGVTPEGTHRVRAGLFLSMSGEAWFDDVRLSKLDDVPLPYDDWGTVASEAVVLRHSPDHPRAAEMTAYHRRLEQAKAEICRRLDVDFDEPITVYLYKDNAEARPLAGGDLDFADPQGRRVHQRWESFIAHEMTHVIAHTRLQNAGTGLFGEGVAVWLDGRSPEQHHGRAAALLRQGELPSVAGLLSDFRALKQSYPAAGSFVGFLLESHGLEAFKRLYPLLDPSAVAEEHLGQRLEAMQDAWHALLARY